MIEGVADALVALYEVWLQEDATLAEINPLIVTPEREVKALDSKVSLDDNALYRHPENQELADKENEDPIERRAKEQGVQYVKLDGDIGILGNGAGLVMSTLDVVAQAGGKPANFLDAGGGSDAAKVKQAVELILANDSVKAVLFNIFGGITRCDEVAKGLIAAFEELKPSVPFVVRLDGTNDVEGRKLLEEADLPNVHAARTMNEAAEKVVALAAGKTCGRPRLMSVLVDKNTRLAVAGITGREGSFHTLNNQRYGTNVVGGVTPGKGGQDVEGIPVFNSWARGGRERAAEHGDDLRAAALRRRFDPRGRRGGGRAGDRDHRGHPRARRAAGSTTRSSATIPRHAADRPELPGHPVSGEGERGDHPGELLQGGQRRRGLALGHADLPDRQRDRPGRVRLQLDRRDRRRPGAGLVVRGRDRAVRGGRADRADRAVRRDRRIGRGGGRRVHRRAT